MTINQISVAGRHAMTVRCSQEMERGVPCRMTTIAALRCCIAEYFGKAETRTALLRLREAGLLPWGCGGRGGSAEITTRHAVLALIGLASGAEPINAPAEAVRIGAFKLLRRDQTHSSEPARRVAFENQTVDLLTVMANEVERADEDHPPSSWDIAAHGACQVHYDRLVFGPSLAALTDPSDSVVRSCRIPGRLLADVAALFHAERVEAAA
jgi:hypothetical protein